MKNKMTRILCAAVALLLVCCCFACGKTNDPTQSSSEASGTGSASSAEPVEPNYINESLTELTYVANGILSFRDASSGKLGLLDSGLNIILPAEYTAVKYCSVGNLCVMTLADGSEISFHPDTGAIEQGNFCAHGFDSPIIWDAENKRVCYWNEFGELEPVESAYLPKAGEARVIRSSGEDVKFGIIGEGGKLLVEPACDWISDFSDGLAAVCLNGMWGYVNISGELVIGYYYSAAYKSVSCMTLGTELAYDAGSGYVGLVRDGNLAGIYTTSGELACGFIFRDIIPLGNGSFAALYNGKWISGTVAELSLLR